MIKSFAATLVIVIPAVIGFGQISILRRRIQTLTEFITAFELMRSEICTRLTPLTELVKIMSREMPVCGFFVALDTAMKDLGHFSFPQIWFNALNAAPGLGLKDDDIKILGFLGLQLGRYEAGEQEAALSNVIRRLEKNLTGAKGELGVKGNLYAGLGIASGLLLAVLLI